MCIRDRSDIIPGYAIFCSASPDCVNTHNTNPWVAIGGTSAATPLLAGGFARIDQGLRTNRREALGLVNPLLYRTARVPGVFYDVTSYGNDVGPDIPGNGQPLGCCAAGPGYDDASGLGSVNVAAFAAQALAAQPLVVSLGIRVPGGQRPVRSRHLLATVSCSGPCVMGAYAMVTIGRSKPFEVDSNVFRLRAAGSKTIKVSFSGRQLANLRSALAAGKRITATLRGALFDSSVYGVLPDPANSFRQSTPGKNLTISG